MSDTAESVSPKAAETGREPEPGELAYRSSWETIRSISHEEAREIAHRLINSHFHPSGRADVECARASIPANPDRDDDLLIVSYIKQQARKEAALSPAPAGVEVAMRALDDISNRSWRAVGSAGAFELGGLRLLKFAGEIAQVADAAFAQIAVRPNNRKEVMPDVSEQGREECSRGSDVTGPREEVRASGGAQLPQSKSEGLELEATARRIAARKCGIADPTGSRLSEDIWRQALDDARAALAQLPQPDTPAVPAEDTERAAFSAGFWEFNGPASGREFQRAMEQVDKAWEEYRAARPIPDTPAVPVGHVVVPVEPTEAMLRAGDERTSCGGPCGNLAANRVWYAMIAAAQPAKTEG